MGLLYLYLYISLRPSQTIHIPIVVVCVKLEDPASFYSLRSKEVTYQVW
jgi:hypothetical protein